MAAADDDVDAESLSAQPTEEHHIGGRQIADWCTIARIGRTSSLPPPNERTKRRFTLRPMRSISR